MTGPVELAKSVLSAGGDPYATLSLAPGMPAVTAATAMGEGRRNYMRLAAAIHPDRIGDEFKEATSAFQMLVKAFEAFANPPKAPAAKKASKPAAHKPQAKKAAPKKKKPTKEWDTASSGSSESDDDFAVPADVEVEDDVVIRAHANTGCHRTPVACPNCRTGWQPDDSKHYTLFMNFGMKTYCQLCLLQYGWATALHACPLCKKLADYDPSMYGKQVSCGKCKGSYGFNYYSVTPQLVLDIRMKEKQAEAAEEKKKDREARAAERTGGDEDITMHIGACMVDDKCPLCKKAVRSKHRQHVTECAKKPASERPKPKQVRAFVVGEGKKKPAKKRTPAKKTQLAKKSPASKAKAKPKAKRSSRKKRDDSDSD